jgi:hypothetical protein
MNNKGDAPSKSNRRNSETLFGLDPFGIAIDAKMDAIDLLDSALSESSFSDSESS